MQLGDIYLMAKEEYGDNFKEHLLEQYKLFVEMMDRTSRRRTQTNMFYVSLLSGLLALLSIIVDKDVFSDFQIVIFMIVGVLGLVLCVVWYVNIGSYRQLNKGKFEIIHEMEKKLPFPCYTKEWDVLDKGKDYKTYRRLSKVEQRVPIIMIIPYVLLMLFSLYLVCRYFV